MGKSLPRTRKRTTNLESVVPGIGETEARAAALEKERKRPEAKASEGRSGPRCGQTGEGGYEPEAALQKAESKHEDTALEAKRVAIDECLQAKKYR